MDNLFLIVGLGNPGREYARTRHNAGFLLVDRLAERWKTDWRDEKKFGSQLAKADRNARRLVLCKPQTYMNASGEAVGGVAEFYRIAAGQILVLVDDADLPFGEIRMRKGGSSGGHHGLESIQSHLATQDFPRLRIGIGRTQANVREITNYVLGQFNAADNELLEKILKRASDQVESWLDEGIDKAMSKFNGLVEPAKKEQ